MGASHGSHVKQAAVEKEKEDPWKNLPDKNSNWNVPETIYDSLPEWKEDHPPIEPHRFDMNHLIQLSKAVIASRKEGGGLKGDLKEELETQAQKLLSALNDHRTVILTMSPSQTEAHKALLSAWHTFLSQPNKSAKREFSSSRTYRNTFPNRPSKVQEGAEEIRSGYFELYFDNRNNFRDEEWRDVWLMFGADFNRPERDWPSDALREATKQQYYLYWDACIALLILIEAALKLPRGDLLRCLSKSDDPLASLAPENSEESNFSIFHYYDNVEEKKVKKIYDGVQKCMVHRDSGFITLLPKATQPGIQALCQLSSEGNEAAYFVDMEKFTDYNEVIVYTGRMLEMKTQGKVRPLIHRVVRHPGLERMSSPFEAKPSLKAVIAEAEIVKSQTGEKQLEKIEAGVLDKAMAWDRLQRTVMRADGIPPEEHSKHLQGEYTPYLMLYGDTMVASE